MSLDLSPPEFLYRYRPLRYIRKRSVIRDEISLIKKGFVWLSKPKDLNDPFDCRPICTYEQTKRLEALLEQFRVCSLSAVPPDSLEASPMWSHYANNHRGICIEFSFDREKFRKSIPIEKVRYSNSRFDLRGLDPEKMRITAPPRVGVCVPEPENNDPCNNIDILELTRKSEAWIPEKEWRFIWSQGYKKDQTALISKPSKVILGCQMSKRTKADLIKRLKKTGVPVAESVRSETGYKLELIG